MPIGTTFCETDSAGFENRGRILVRNLNSLLAQKIEVGVTAGTLIDDSGKVA